jgi:hypothetical protein
MSRIPRTFQAVGLACWSSWCALACGDSVEPDADAALVEAAECARHSDCVDAYDEPYVCREGTCLRLKNSLRNDNDASVGDDTGDCSLVLGAENLAKHSDVFVIGALVSRFPYSIPTFAAAASAYELAALDFTQQLDENGLRIAGKARAPVVVVCDVTEAPDGGLTPERLRKTIDHLAHTLGVPAIIAPLWPARLQEAFLHAQAHGKPVFFLSPFESEPGLLEMDDSGLLWHLQGRALDVVPAYVEAIRRAEAHVRGQRADDGAPLRVALIDSEQQNHKLCADALEQSMLFNGKSAEENGPETFLRLELESAQLTWLPRVTAALESLGRFRPDIVVSTGGIELMNPLQVTLEQFLTETGGSERLPFYIFSPTHRTYAGAIAANVLLFPPGLERRLIGVSHAGAPDGANRAKYLGRTALLSPPHYEAEFDGSEVYYDAIYSVMYAAAAAGDKQELDGADVARGMLKLVSGAAIDVGVGDIRKAGGLLAAGSSIALHGTLGPPAFDLSTGARLADSSLWCLLPSETRSYLTPLIDVMRYEPSTGSFSGTLPCFPDF